MPFGVIICPHCHHVKGADLSKKTTQCLKCGKRLNINQLQPRLVTDDQQRLALAVREVATRMKGGQEPYKQSLEEYQRVQQPQELHSSDKDQALMERPAAYTPSSKMKDRLIAIIMELTEHGQSFDLEAFENALKIQGFHWQRSQEFLIALKADGVLYEPRPGRYKIA